MPRKGLINLKWSHPGLCATYLKSNHLQPFLRLEWTLQSSCTAHEHKKALWRWAIGFFGQIICFGFLYYSFKCYNNSGSTRRQIKSCQPSTLSSQSSRSSSAFFADWTVGFTDGDGTITDAEVTWKESLLQQVWCGLPEITWVISLHSNLTTWTLSLEISGN